MADLLAGEVAVVTGGTNGIGRSIATTFAEEGADVVVADVREKPFEREGELPTHEYIKRHTTAEATFVQCDVSELEALEAAIGAAEAFGGITTMVNNAGILMIEDGFRLDEPDFERLVGVHLKGTYYGCSFAAERMVEAGTEGSIVNMSSVAGLLGLGKEVAYSTVKGGIRLMTYAWADGLGEYGIRVNTLHPGVTQTHLTVGDLDVAPEETDQWSAAIEATPLRRTAQPEEIANGALYLASDLASFVTGESLVIDGGLASSHKL